jgi:LmbE family N-acetylglucosaminyl deacetylase
MRHAAYRAMRKTALTGTLTLVSGLWLAAAGARAAGTIRAFTDRAAYNAGAVVYLAVAAPDGEAAHPPADLHVTVRYAGDPQPVLDHAELTENSGGAPAAYRRLWRIPLDARTGRYTIAVAPSAGDTERDAASFTVYRKLVEITGIKLPKTFYASGDPVACQVTLRNLTDHPLDGLRVEFSDRYWPWIAGPAQQAAESIRTLSADLSLSAGQQTQLHSGACAVAAQVAKPGQHQYGVVVWDQARRNIYDISFSQLTFIRPPGSSAPTPYPPQYVYPELKDVNTASYRHFYPPDLNFGAVRFDAEHTMYPLEGSAPVKGSEATVTFALANPTDAPWRGVGVVARLLDSGGRELTRQVVEARLDLIPGAAPLERAARFQLPEAGLYLARVQVVNSFGQVLATNDLELAANPLPKSILIFCAHEDDEGGWSGWTRAAIENHIPIHFVYFTGGDAGSCDRYYQRPCGPAEALNFGELRMNETRASLGHLGVEPEDILFFGLPDGGSGQIWYDHPGAAEPYLSVMLASDHAPYPSLALPNLPYARDAAVAEVERLLSRFRPEVIVTAHPSAEGHIDHIVCNYFVVKALQDMLQKGTLDWQPRLLVDRVYDAKTLPPTPYHYAQHVFYVPGEVLARAQEAWWFYQSQGGNGAQGRLRDFAKLKRQVPYREVLDWKEHAGWNEKR